MMDGTFLIGASRVERPETFVATDPATGMQIEPPFSASSDEDVVEACRLADAAFNGFRELSIPARATFLETVASEIEALGDALMQRAHQESGLPIARLAGERGRTTGQLRLFANLLREGSWADVTIDPAQPERHPLPRSDLRLRRIAVGPVAVFGASNFPLAFSVAGGDTASAWAAGCPVVVKGHPAHPGTSTLVASAIRKAVETCDLHEGVFLLLQGPSSSLGGALVTNLHIKAVGFTGSRAGGLALIDIAARRHEPIPVYAEMSSINPVLLLPAGLTSRAEALGAAFVGSLTLGSGQFCTNPGVVLALDSPDLDTFVVSATSDSRSTPVGALAIDRFLRPVCYQDLPEELLPEALRDDNPLGLPRRINGRLE